MGYWENRAKEITERTIIAFNERKIPNWYVFAPFIRWKQQPREKPKLSEVNEMRRVALCLIKGYDRKHPTAFSEMDFREDGDIFFMFGGYQEDKEVVGILSNMVEEITPFLFQGMP